MSNVCDHFIAAFLYGILPLGVFSALNLLIATLGGMWISANVRDAQILGVSFGAIGVGVGLFMGLSRDSVVGTVVPAVLTFLSGFAVYQFGKESYEQWRPILPIALLCLIIGSVNGAMFASTERNNLLQETRRYEEWRMQYEKLELPLRLKQLEKELGVPLTPK